VHFPSQRVIPADAQPLAVLNAPARQQLERRRVAIHPRSAECGILQRRIIPAFRVSYRSVFAPHANRRAGPVQDVQRADFFEREIIQPELASPASPYAGIQADGREIEAVEQHRQLAPIAAGRHVKVVGRQRPVAREHLNLECPNRIQAFRFQPHADAVAAMRLDLHLLHHAAMTVRIGAEVLHPQRRLAAVFRVRVLKADLPRLVVEPEALELIPRELLKAPVGKTRRLVGQQACFAAVHLEHSILDWQALGQLPVVRQRGPAVADGKDGRNQFQVVSFARSADLVQTPKVVRRPLAQRIQPERDDRAVQSMLRSRLENPRDLLHVAVAAQVPAEDPHKAVLVRGGMRRRRRQKRRQQCETSQRPRCADSSCYLPRIVELNVHDLSP
jgi:hypothetical protein